MAKFIILLLTVVTVVCQTVEMQIQDASISGGSVQIGSETWSPGSHVLILHVSTNSSPQIYSGSNLIATLDLASVNSSGLAVTIGENSVQAQETSSKHGWFLWGFLAGNLWFGFAFILRIITRITNHSPEGFA